MAIVQSNHIFSYSQFLERDGSEASTGNVEQLVAVKSWIETNLIDRDLLVGLQTQGEFLSVSLYKRNLRIGFLMVSVDGSIIFEQKKQNSPSIAVNSNDTIIPSETSGLADRAYMEGKSETSTENTGSTVGLEILGLFTEVPSEEVFDNRKKTLSDTISNITEKMNNLDSSARKTYIDEFNVYDKEIDNVITDVENNKGAIYQYNSQNFDTDFPPILQSYQTAQVSLLSAQASGSPLPVIEGEKANLSDYFERKIEEAKSKENGAENNDALLYSIVHQSIKEFVESGLDVSEYNPEFKFTKDGAFKVHNLFGNLQKSKKLGVQSVSPMPGVLSNSAEPMYTNNNFINYNLLMKVYKFFIENTKGLTLDPTSIDLPFNITLVNLFDLYNKITQNDSYPGSTEFRKEAFGEKLWYREPGEKISYAFVEFINPEFEKEQRTGLTLNSYPLGINYAVRLDVEGEVEGSRDFPAGRAVYGAPDSNQNGYSQAFGDVLSIDPSFDPQGNRAKFYSIGNSYRVNNNESSTLRIYPWSNNFDSSPQMNYSGIPNNFSLISDNRIGYYMNGFYKPDGYSSSLALSEFSEGISWKDGTNFPLSSWVEETTIHEWFYHKKNNLLMMYIVPKLLFRSLYDIIERKLNEVKEEFGFEKGSLFEQESPLEENIGKIHNIIKSMPIFEPPGSYFFLNLDGTYELRTSGFISDHVFTTHKFGASFGEAWREFLKLGSESSVLYRGEGEKKTLEKSIFPNELYIESFHPSLTTPQGFPGQFISYNQSEYEYYDIMEIKESNSSISISSKFPSAVSTDDPKYGWIDAINQEKFIKNLNDSHNKILTMSMSPTTKKLVKSGILDIRSALQNNSWASDVNQTRNKLKPGSNPFVSKMWVDMLEIDYPTSLIDSNNSLVVSGYYDSNEGTNSSITGGQCFLLFGLSFELHEFLSTENKEVLWTKLAIQNSNNIFPWSTDSFDNDIQLEAVDSKWFISPIIFPREYQKLVLAPKVFGKIERKYEVITPGGKYKKEYDT
jgi:hypothetical protein